MTTRWKALVCVLAFCACWVGPVAARQDPGTGQAAALLEQVTGVNRSLERLVNLLEDSLDRQQIDLLLKRIELRERRLAPLEAQLHRAENRLSNAEDEVARMTRMLEEQEKNMRERIRNGADPATVPERGMLEEIKMHLEVENGQIEQLDELLEERLE